MVEISVVSVGWAGWVAVPVGGVGERVFVGITVVGVFEGVALLGEAVPVTRIWAWARDGSLLRRLSRVGIASPRAEKTRIQRSKRRRFDLR